jgi:hypothetical protein
MPNLLACLALGFLTLGQGPDGGVPTVEPSALTRDPNLIGREVVVDDRIRYFLPHKGAKGQVFDELLLKRTDVIFKLPPDLRSERPPRAVGARVTGVLQSDGRQVTCDVTRLELFPADLERFDREVKRLPPGDSAGRVAWANWAERRAKDFKDTDLAARARTIETEALLIDADRPGSDDLALSRRARTRELGGDLANALAHRALRARLDAARSADDLSRLAGEVTSFLPRSTEPKVLGGIEDWKSRVKTNPIYTYPQAPEEVKAALDRALLADVLQRNLERRLADSPNDATTLSEEARTKLPDRPEVALRFRERGLASSEGSVTRMRLSEVEALAKTFRDDGQAGRARAVLKTWLDDQRKRLNPGDVDGQVILAGQYERVLDDRGTAAVLLNDALKVDPQSKAAADAFRRMGYRKTDKGSWVDPAIEDNRPEGQATEAPNSARQTRDDSVLGMSPEQVRQKLGPKPDRIVRSATQNATIEQWIYKSTKTTRVVNFRKGRGKAQAEVVGDFTVK